MNVEFFDKAASVLPKECFETPPELGIILGSGWGESLTCDKTIAEIKYSDIPGLGAATVIGHAGEFKLYERAGKRIVAFCGRRHWYEGIGWEGVVLPIELLRRMGCKGVLLTNAVGGEVYFYGCSNDTNATISAVDSVKKIYLSGNLFKSSLITAAKKIQQVCGPDVE
jgi:hypothetical protein